MSNQVNEVIGVVVNCKWLDLRSEPDNQSPIVYIAAYNDQLIVDLEKSTDEYYRVCTAFGIECYAGKEFVQLTHQLN